MSNDRLLRRKNVVGYGDGIKKKGGKSTGEAALVIFVEKKTSDISPEDFIPEVFDGKKTDVIETGVIKTRLLQPCKTSTMQKTIVPLRGGLEIGYGSTFGTLGTLVKDRTTSKIVALTNSHVAWSPLNITDSQADALTDAGVSFIRGDTATGQSMTQSITTEGHIFGKVFRDYRRSPNLVNPIDAATITIDSEYGVTPGIMGLTKYVQNFIHPNTVPYGAEVIKSGRTTGITKGEVTALNATISVQGEGGLAFTYTNQIVISSSDTETPFAGAGDSGSALCVDIGNERVGLIGLVSAGSEVSETGSVGVASRLDVIVEKLDVVPWDGKIIISTGHSDVVSTGGAVYTKDIGVFLNTTNDYVCEGAVCGLAPAEIYSAAHSIFSLGHGSRLAEIVLKEKVLNIEAVCNTDVVVGIEPDISLGYMVEVPVLLDAKLSATAAVSSGFSLDADIFIDAAIDAKVSMAGGIESLLREAVTLSIYSHASADINNPVVCNADIGLNLLSGVEANAEIGYNTDCLCDSSILVDVNSGAVASLASGLSPINSPVIFVSTKCNAEVNDQTVVVSDVGISLMISSFCHAENSAISYGPPTGSVSSGLDENSDDLFFEGCV